MPCAHLTHVFGTRGFCKCVVRTPAARSSSAQSLFTPLLDKKLCVSQVRTQNHVCYYYLLNLFWVILPQSVDARFSRERTGVVTLRQLCSVWAIRKPVFSFGLLSDRFCLYFHTLPHFSVAVFEDNSCCLFIWISSLTNTRLFSSCAIYCCINCSRRFLVFIFFMSSSIWYLS